MKVNFSEEFINEKLQEFSKTFDPDSLKPSGISLSELASKIDHTLLKPDATNEEIKLICEQAREYKFASVCVNPSYVPDCFNLLKDTIIKVCTVIGFPLGSTFKTAKLIETEEAIKEGAEEVDMVLNIGQLKCSNLDYVLDEISSVCNIAKKFNVLTKVIIETCLLTDKEKILACILSEKAGADFVKTSTGFSKGGATIKDVALMKFIVGDRLKVKASGGIRTREDALKMIAAGASRIGASSSVEIIKGIKKESSY